MIQAAQLTKRYGSRRGVDSLQFSVEAGQIFGFLGPNGAGKTTTIRLLLGLVHPSSGAAHVFGLDCWRQSHRIKRDVGYLPGDLRLYPWMTTKSALQIFGQIRGLDLMSTGAELAERLQLEMDLKIRKMSRGTRQKVGLVLALAHRPRLVILDEPTSALDPLMQDELARLLRERARQGDTIFFSSHTLSEVEQLCDRIAIVREGRIAAEESLSELRRRVARPVAIVFSDQVSADGAQLPGFLQRVTRNGTRWQGELTGPAQPLVQWAAQQPICDLEIGQPNLEEVFRSYYRTSDREL